MEKVCPLPNPYTEDILRDVFAEFSFSQEEQIAIKRALEDSAYSWHASRYDEVSMEQAADLQKKLDKIYRLSIKLRTQITDIPHNTWVDLFGFTEAIQPDIVRPAFEGDGSPDFELVTHPRYGPRREILIDLGELKGFLWSLSQVSLHMEGGLHFEKKYSRNEYKLHNWIRQIRTMWEQRLNRRFTRDALNSGEPISEAARFCVTTYKVLDPKTPPSRVLDAMKKHIKFANEWKLEEKRRNPE